MKKWLKITLITIGSILLLLLLVLLLASPIAKSYVNNHGKELIGREIHVDGLRVNLLTGHVHIQNLTVYEDDATTSFFSFDTLDVAVKLGKLLRHEVYVKHITLANPKVRVIQNGDRFNFSSIIDHFASDEEKPEDTTASDWKLGFYNIRLSGGEVYYADKKMNSKWDLKNLNVKVPGVYFDGSENTDAGIELQLADGGVLRTDASLNMDDNSFSVNLDLKRFAISNVRAYLTDVILVSRMDGKLDAKVKVKGNLSDIMKMNISGNVALRNVDIRDLKNEPVLAVGKLAVNVNRINLNDNVFDIKSVAIDHLVSHYDQYKNGSNFDRLFPGTQASQPAEEEEETQTAQSVSKPLRLKVGSFNLTDAEFTYNDHTLPDLFSFPVTKINVTSENLSMSGENNAKIRAQLPHGGMAFINWKGNIDDWKKNQRLSLNIRSLHLKDVSPYAVAYLGHPFTEGTFSFTSENIIRNSQLDGKNKIDLYKPEVGKKRKDVDPEVKIPLKAALYVLKDKDGKVQFDVPVAGNIDSPEFSYMKIVWKTLGNLLVKVATSPYRLVANAFGGNGDIEFIEFNPLQFDFTSEQYNTLSHIADVINYDTNVIVTLEPQINISEAAKEQSYFNLKKEFYLAQHPDKAAAPHLEMIDFSNIESITHKDAEFVAYLIEKGYITDKSPREKAVRAVAEEHYPLAQSEEQQRRLAEMRNRFMRNYFVERMGVPESQIVIGNLIDNAKKDGYSLKSQLKGTETE